MSLTYGICPPKPLCPVAGIIFLLYKRGTGEVKIKIIVPAGCLRGLLIPWISEMSGMNDQFGMGSQLHRPEKQGRRWAMRSVEENACMRCNRHAQMSQPGPRWYHISDHCNPILPVANNSPRPLNPIEYTFWISATTVGCQYLSPHMELPCRDELWQMLCPGQDPS